MRRVTISDVAQLAGVSKSTVSHVLNDTRFVSIETREKVLHAVNELEYRPSVIARSLVSQRTLTAGLLISDIGNPFYHDVINGVEEVAVQNGYSLFLCNTSYDTARSIKLIHSLIDQSVDGVMFMSSNMNLEMLLEVAQHQIPAVVLDWESLPSQGAVGNIRLNFELGTLQAVQHLVQLGHRCIAYASGPLSLVTARVRRDAFLLALEKNSLEPYAAPIFEGNLRIEGGYRVFDQLNQVHPRPTALIAANDLTALGILWAARKEGLRIPEELSLVGLDDIDLASKVTPALTSISLPRFEIGNLAMQMLLGMIQNPNQESQEREVPTGLIVRQSTAAAARA